MPLSNTDQCGEVKLRQNQDSERTWTNIVCVRVCVRHNHPGNSVTRNLLAQNMDWVPFLAHSQHKKNQMCLCQCEMESGSQKTSQEC